MPLQMENGTPSMGEVAPPHHAPPRFPFLRVCVSHSGFDVLMNYKRVSVLCCVYAGNPVRSLEVAEWATGYTRWLAHLGYTSQSAHPWSLSDLQTVLEVVDQRIASAQGISLLKLLRDAFTMTILWETCSRGATAVSWCLEDIWLPTGNHPVALCVCVHALGLIFSSSSYSPLVWGL